MAEPLLWPLLLISLSGLSRMVKESILLGLQAQALTQLSNKITLVCLSLGLEKGASVLSQLEQPGFLIVF